MATFLAESLEFAERLYDATMGAFPYRNEMSFVELADQIILNLPEKFGIQPLSETKMPMITPQSLFFYAVRNTPLPSSLSARKTQAKRLASEFGGTAM